MAEQHTPKEREDAERKVAEPRATEDPDTTERKALEAQLADEARRKAEEEQQAKKEADKQCPHCQGALTPHAEEGTKAGAMHCDRCGCCFDAEGAMRDGHPQCMMAAVIPMTGNR